MRFIATLSLLAFLVFLRFPQLLAQEEYINITVVNAETKEPVSFATISFPEQQYGFSANENGQFRLPVSPSNVNRQIIISSIGYERFESTLGKLLEDNTSLISLQPAVTILEEILIRASQETPQDIIRQAERNMKSHLGNTPYYLYAFYKETVKQNHQFTGYTEAYGIFHITGYHNNYNHKNRLLSYDLAQWKNIRRSDYKTHPKCDDEEKSLGIYKLLHAKSEYLYNGPFSKHHDDFRYTMDSVSNFEGKDVFIIGFQAMPGSPFNYSGQAYVKADDYALLKLNIVDNNSVSTAPMKCNLEKAGSNFSLSYTRVGERYFLNNLKLISKYDKQGNVVIESLEINAGEYRDNAVASLNRDQRIVLYKEMLNPDISYDPNFWEQQNVHIQEEVIESLSDVEPLPRQFFTNSGKRIEPLPEEFDTYQELYQDQEAFQLFMKDDF